ncbi:MAG: vanadium-dependent haloperoxidase [Candidatus Limnocylindrales bacterium]
MTERAGLNIASEQDGAAADPSGASPNSPRRRRSAITPIIALVVVALIAVGLGVTRPWVQQPSCPAVADHPEWSVARRWDEVLLDAIRRALPNPPVHARNLFHVSVAMWDAWAAYDPIASGYIVTEKVTASNVSAARNEAISYAAYRLLSSRFIASVGGEESLSEFADVMDALCYPLDRTSPDGDTPAALGNRIAAAVVRHGLTDGSNEGGGYASPDYKPVNPPLVVSESGTVMTDPNRWQPLQIERMISQNGIPVIDGVQQAIGPHWGHVTSFGLPDGGTAGVPIDPGPPPRLGEPASDQAFKDQAVQVIRYSSLLDPALGNMIDISPAARGNNTLGTNDGTGRPMNPTTGQPYAQDLVNEGDFARVMAEFWADGPSSETPPGHWNAVANLASDALPPDLRIAGTGPAVDRLQWDVKLYFALNGAVHDAAIEAWGLKGHYDSTRPISMIRYLADQGQSTDPTGPSYDKDGIPLVPDLIELITQQTTQPGQRHAGLAGHEGEIALKAWAGSGVRWILAADWVPYQLPTFVTPSFQGYVSGHSAFSRAAAEVLAAFTGSEYFPGGLGGYTIKAGSLKFEAGPTTDIQLEWATYYDASDQAGQSRLYGGIHIEADDLTGRMVGAQCGKAAWALAQRYYTGTSG